VYEHGVTLRRRQLVLPAVLAAAWALSPLPAATGASCRPSIDQGVNPNYIPGAPVRATIGKGHVLSGVVRTSDGCRPIARARIELFQAGPGGEYAFPRRGSWPGRSTVLTARNGSYRFQGPFPGGGEPHIHLKVSAPGHQEVHTTYFTRTKQGRLDLVLRAETV
jgi:protocatechuate 3,4-dioxygenase beta subunit